MVQWIVEHAIVAVFKQICLIPYRIGGVIRTGVEHAQAGYKGATLKIFLPPLILGTLTILLFVFVDVYISLAMGACIWGLAVMGFMNCRVSDDLVVAQQRHWKIEPWIADFKRWYEQDVHNKQVPWKTYYISLALTYGSYTMGKFQQESKPEKITQLRSFISEDAQGNRQIKTEDYVCFLADNLGDEVRHAWSTICRNDTKQTLKLNS
jgi:hypothetical protein